MKLAERCYQIKASPTTAMSARVAQLREQGENIISFNIGEPDFPTPKHICDAAFDAINAGFTKYAPGSGFSDLRKAIVEKLKKDNSLAYDPSQITVSNGAKQAVYNAVLACAGRGDQVIIPTPCWVSYTEMVKLADAEPVLVPTDEKKGFALDLDAIEKAITDKTRAIIVCTPNNPTGAVYTKDQLEKLAELAIKHDFMIISDEIYEKLIYEDAVHVSIGSLSPEAFAHTITINGASKAYSMTGWRMGFSAAPKEIAKAINSFQSQMTSASCSISQKASLAAFAGDQTVVAEMRDEFAKRRVYLQDRFEKIPGVTCPMAKGAFYLMPDFSSYIGKEYNGKKIENSVDLCEFLLEYAKIATVPGEAFFAPGRIRFSYSNSLENIKEGIDRLEKALQLLK